MCAAGNSTVMDTPVYPAILALPSSSQLFYSLWPWLPLRLMLTLNLQVFVFRQFCVRSLKGRWRVCLCSGLRLWARPESQWRPGALAQWADSCASPSIWPQPSQQAHRPPTGDTDSSTDRALGRHLREFSLDVVATLVSTLIPPQNQSHGSYSPSSSKEDGCRTLINLNASALGVSCGF